MDNAQVTPEITNFSFNNAPWKAASSWLAVCLLLPIGLGLALAGKGNALSDTIGFRFAGLVCIALGIFFLRLARSTHQNLRLSRGMLTWRRGGWPFKRRSNSIDLATVVTIRGSVQTTIVNVGYNRTPIITYILSFYDIAGTEFDLNLVNFSVKHRRYFFKTLMPLLGNSQITKQGQIREVAKAMTGYAYFHSMANQLPADCP